MRKVESKYLVSSSSVVSLKNLAKMSVFSFSVSSEKTTMYFEDLRSSNNKFLKYEAMIKFI